MDKPRVLLTASYGPNELGWGEDMYDLLTSRLARGHGPFQMTSHCHYFGLYLIAENIKNPTTVLENPHWEEFDRELDEGYDYVGFQLKSLHTKKVAEMMKRIREKSPGTRIVVGGYGVGTLGNPVPGDTDGDAVYIRDNADHLCREEGVGFMRRILGDEPQDREISQYHLPTTGFSVAGLGARLRLPIILVSLGCPNACDFCNTSAFFHHKKIYVAEPEQVYRFIKNYQKRLKYKDLYVLLFDEDIFLNPEYVRELGRLLRSDKDTWGVRWFSFGSMRSMSQFTPEELRDCGLGAVWIGVESFLSGEGTTEDHYAKRKGKEIKEIFEGLHQNGIVTVGSLVLGFDFHDHENLTEDIDRFVDLKPFFYQLSPLTPCPGTPLYERMEEEGRIKDTYKWEDFTLWKDDVFELANFEPGEIKEHFDYAHRQIRDKLGPPPLQFAENMLDVAQNLKGYDDDYHKYLCKRAQQLASASFSYLRGCELHHHSGEVRERAAELERRYRQEVGRPPVVSKALSYHISNNLRKATEAPPPEVVSDPPPRWTYYNTFDHRVWVRKGRKQKKPVPYRDWWAFSREKHG
ncbi:MAG: radical SAM protein [bacterium]